MSNDAIEITCFWMKVLFASLSIIVTVASGLVLSLICQSSWQWLVVWCCPSSLVSFVVVVIIDNNLVILPCNGMPSVSSQWHLYRQSTGSSSTCPHPHPPYYPLQPIQCALVLVAGLQSRWLLSGLHGSAGHSEWCAVEKRHQHRPRHSDAADQRFRSVRRYHSRIHKSDL